MVKKLWKKTIGGIPFTAHRAQIIPPLIFNFCFSHFYAYFRLGLVKLGLGLPRRVRDPLELGKKLKSKIRGGVYLCSKSKTQDSPQNFNYKTATLLTIVCTLISCRL